MSGNQFVGARLKVERAKRHIGELNVLLQGFLNSNFCELRVENDAETGSDYIQLVSTAEPPVEMALATGDAVHNLRSALDFVITSVVGRANNRIGFPMDEERDNLIRSDKYRTIKKSSPKVADVILDTVKPYKSGNYSIWALGKLDNVDKHKLLIPAIQVISVTIISAKNKSGSTVMNNVGLGMMGGGVFRPLGFPDGIKIDNYGKPAADIVFGKVGYFESEPIIPTLFQLSHAVLEVLASIEDVFFV